MFASISIVSEQLVIDLVGHLKIAFLMSRLSRRVHYVNVSVLIKGLKIAKYHDYNTPIQYTATFFRCKNDNFQ